MVFQVFVKDSRGISNHLLHGAVVEQRGKTGWKENLTFFCANDCAQKNIVLLQILSMDGVYSLNLPL